MLLVPSKVFPDTQQTERDTHMQAGEGEEDKTEKKNPRTRARQGQDSKHSARPRHPGLDADLCSAGWRAGRDKPSSWQLPCARRCSVCSRKCRHCGCVSLQPMDGASCPVFTLSSTTRVLMPRPHESGRTGLLQLVFPLFFFCFHPAPQTPRILHPEDLAWSF